MWSIHAAAELEKRGVAALAYGTDAFDKMTRLHARAAGIPDLPAVFMPHPLGGLTVEQALVKADTTVEEVAVMMQRYLEQR